MGLFDLFSRPERGREEKRPTESLMDYNGIRVEVLSEEKEMLFVAKLVVSQGGLAELQQITKDTVELEEGVDSLPVELRGFEDKLGLAIHMECVISPQELRLWRADKLKIKGKDNDRAFYRQSTTSTGEVVQVGKLRSDSATCEILNISAGGTCLRTRAPFQKGDRLLLRSRLIPISQTSSLLCQVCRVTKRSVGFWEYGCKFVEMEGKLEDQIAKTIMDLQRQRINR